MKKSSSPLPRSLIKGLVIPEEVRYYKVMSGFIKSFCILAILSLLLSCESVPRSVDQGWEGERFFKEANAALDANKLQTALYYYEVFLVRYPEDHSQAIAAEYARALTYSKLGETERAKYELEKILAKYESDPYLAFYPPQYKVLAKNVLTQLKGEKLPVPARFVQDY